MTQQISCAIARVAPELDFPVPMPLGDQRMRLEALEKKLDATAAQQATVAQQAAAAQAAAQQVAAANDWKPKLLASADWEPGYTFQITPVDTVTLYGLIDVTLSDISNSTP